MSITSYAFLLVFFGGLVMCVVKNPIWGLYTYLAVFYLDPPDRWWGHSLPDLRWSLLAATATLLCLLFRRRNDGRLRLFSYGLPWILLLYVTWMWIQTPFALSSQRLFGPVLFTKYLVLLYLIYEIVDSKERVRDFLMAHIVGCFYLGWLAYTAVGGGRLEGVGGPGIDDANTMSMHFGTGVIVGSMLLMTERRWRFWLVLAAMPFMLNGMVQGSSRGAFLGLIAGGLALLRLKPPTYTKQFIAFGILGALLFAYLANGFFLHRMASLEAVTDDQQQLDFSAASRLVILQAQLRMFRDHPLGVGYRGTAVLSPEYLSEKYLAMNQGKNRDAQRQRSSHNTFMTVVVNQGIPGIVLLVAALYWIWKSVGLATRRSGQDPRTWAYGAAISAALTLAVVAGQFAPYLKAEVQYWLLALLLSLRSLKRDAVREEAAAAATPPANVLAERPVLSATLRRRKLPQPQSQPGRSTHKLPSKKGMR